MGLNGIMDHYNIWEAMEVHEPFSSLAKVGDLVPLVVGMIVKELVLGPFVVGQELALYLVGIPCLDLLFQLIKHASILDCIQEK